MKIDQGAAAILIFVEEFGGVGVPAGICGIKEGDIGVVELVVRRKSHGGRDGDVLGHREQTAPAIEPEGIIVFVNAVILWTGAEEKTQWFGGRKVCDG